MYTCLYISCSNCGNSSTVQSDYGELELNIQGMKNINDSLSDFFKVSLLDNVGHGDDHCRRRR